MPISGFATPEGTARYRDRLAASGNVRWEHFRGDLGALALSTIGLGTYLGGHDATTDALYLAAIKSAAKTGCNVFDSAINYRCQRSERVVGQALGELVQEGVVHRDEVVIATKGGFIPFDAEPPADPSAYVQRTFVTPGVMRAKDVVADCHCMTPSYLRHQLAASLNNLGLACVDIYYLHNPETQLETVDQDEFVVRIRAAFETLEEAVAQGKLRMYGTATWDGFRAKPGARGHLSLDSLVRVATEVGGKDHHFKVIQLPYNLGMPEALAEQTQEVGSATVSVLEAAKALDVYVMSSASIYQGRLSRGLPTDIRSVLGQEGDAQRAIQFVRSTPGMGTALVGMKHVNHVKENLAVAKTPPLSPDQFARLFK